MIDLSLPTCVVAGLVGGVMLIWIWCVVAAAKRGDEPPAPPRGVAASGGFGGYYMPAYGSPITPADASTSDENAKA